VPVRLMNTIWADRHSVHDPLTTTGDLRAWLTATCPGLDHPDPAPPTSSASGRCATRCAAAQAATWPQLAYHSGGLHPVADKGATPARRALASIAQQAIGLLTGQDGITLRACHAPGCVLYFTRDHPRRQWCSVACGNRARAARHYQRHRNQPSDS
jgi:predicted RNA-binding Zn ribbon-like protein